MAYYVSSGQVSSGIILSDDSMYVNSGGTANSTTVNGNGRLYVSSGATATAITIMSGGWLGMTIAPDTYIQGTSGGSAFVMQNGYIAGYSVNSGWLDISSGGTADSTTMNGGMLYVSSGGTANYTTVNFDGGMVVYSGGTALETTLTGKTVIESDFYYIFEQGCLWVSSGGIAIGTHVNSVGSLRVGGGTATDAIVNSEGNMMIYSSGTATNTTVNSSGYLTVDSGGTANSTTVNSYGSMYVFSGGTANNTTVNSDGSMYVDSGGTATGIVENGGYVSVEDGAEVTFTPNAFSGLVLNYYSSATVHSGTTANSTTVYWASELYVSSGGTANNTTIRLVGRLYVSNGGTANSTTVNSDGDLYVSNGGTANSTTVNSDGDLYVYDGGKVTGSLEIASGAVVSAYEGSIIDFDISGLTEEAPARVNDLSLIQGAPGYSITVSATQAEGEYKLAEGAAGFDKTVTISTTTGISDTITVGSTVELAGQNYTLNLADSLLSLTVGGSPVPTGAVETFSGETLVSAADVMTGKVLAYGGEADTMVVSSGGVAGSTTVNSAGVMNVSGGGTADTTTVNNWGNLYVSSGGMANSTTVNLMGRLNVSSGGTANYTTVNSAGVLYISSGGTADSTTVEYGGDLFVNSGGTANSTTINGGVSGEYGIAGVMNVSSGGVASSTTVNAYGILYVLSGGTANSTTVNSGGILWVSSGAILKGSQIYGDTVRLEGMSVADEADVTFDVVQRPAANSYKSYKIVNNLAYLNARSFSITVSADQADGTYTLAGGAADFDKTVTISTTTGISDTITVGSTVELAGQNYTLNLADSLLSLTVGGSPVPPTPVVGGTTGDLNMDGRADIVMTISQDGHPADGSTGAWLILEDQTAAWGDLSTRNPGWEIFGTGKTASGKNTDDVYIKSSDNVVGAWTTADDGKVNGWETIGEFSSDTQIVGLGDFNGNGQTDLLLRNTNGAVGCFFTGGEKTGWNYFQSLGDEWKLSAVGDLNGDGRDDVVLKHDAGFAGSWLTQADGTMAWADLDTLPDGFEIVGAGDFNADGTDDVLLKSGNYYGAWLVNNGNAAGWMGLGDLGDVTVEQIADFNGDGTDDLRIRTAAGDLGTQLVMGADDLVWKYYGSVGAEWSTSLAALA